MKSVLFTEHHTFLIAFETNTTRLVKLSQLYKYYITTNYVIWSHIVIHQLKWIEKTPMVIAGKTIIIIIIALYLVAGNSLVCKFTYI